MTDYCLTCLYEDYDGAEEPCINCVGVGGKRPSEYLRKKPPKPITNADKIHSMTDEELAEFINGVEAEAIRRAGLFITVGDIQRGKEGWLDWLKEAVD